MMESSVRYDKFLSEWRGKMHIGFYTNAYSPTISGVVRSVGSFRKALTELGHNVFIFSPSN